MRPNKFVYLVVFLLQQQFSYAINYSINFMWINDEVKIDNQNIFPEVRIKEGWNINILDWLRAWVDANSKVEINFWYDGITVNKKQIDNTKNTFIKNFPHISINLKDVNSLEFVKNNPKIFNNNISIYLRVDLLRLIAGLHFLEQCKDRECAFVYADVDKGFEKTEDGSFKPIDLTESSLFDMETIGNLSRYGLVLNKGEGTPENNFFILGNHKPNMLKTIKEAIIEANFLRIENLMEKEDKLINQIKALDKDSPFVKSNWLRGFALSEENDKYIIELENNKLIRDLRQLENNKINLIFESIVNGIIIYFYYLERDTNDDTVDMPISIYIKKLKDEDEYFTTPPAIGLAKKMNGKLFEIFAVKKQTQTIYYEDVPQIPTKDLKGSPTMSNKKLNDFEEYARKVISKNRKKIIK